VSDLGKIGVVAAILGAILLFGLLVQSPEPTREEERTVIEPKTVVNQVTILPQVTLEMLDPIYSEKAVFQDDTIRVAFNASHSEDGVESRLPFWIHNVSDDVINIHWDLCSIQLPRGNTVHIVNEEGLDTLASRGSISIAPAGDLFDAVVPISEIVGGDDAGLRITANILDQGIFTFVLAVERAADLPVVMEQRAMVPSRQPADCSGEAGELGKVLIARSVRCREIVYYTFRFVIR